MRYLLRSNDGVIDRSLSSFSRYEYKTGTQDDPSWHQYLSVLYPPEEGVQKIENRRVLEVLQKKGDRSAIARSVLTHALISDSENGVGTLTALLSLR